MAHPGGRPLLFKTPQELQERIDDYFAQCDPHMEEVTEWLEARNKEGKLLKDDNGLNYLKKVTHKVMTKQIPYTVTGLALHLDTSRETLVNYEEKAEYFDTIKRAKDKIQNYLELNLNSPSPTGTIFNLKNNYGWKDKTESEITNPDGSLNPYNALSPEELRKLASK